MFIKNGTYYLNLDQVLNVNVVENSNRIRLVFNFPDGISPYIEASRIEPDENLMRIRKVLEYLESRVL